MSRLPQPGHRWKDRYEILGELGRGGFGRVYRARDERLGRDVAIKVLVPSDALDGENRARFDRERRTAAGLEHRNIVPIYDSDDVDGLPYLVMRLIDGTDLRRELRDGPLPLARVRSVIDQVAAALDYAHDRGLVHRDVKPANVLCQRDSDQVYLADFGITRPVDQTTGDRITTTGPGPATVWYAAPEQLQRAGRVDGRTDGYALGCVLFECLTGHPPYRGEPFAIMDAHLHHRPPSVLEARPDLSSRWDDVLGRALSKASDDRYQRCADLAAAVERITRDHDATTAPGEWAGNGTANDAARTASGTASGAARTASGTASGAARTASRAASGSANDAAARPAGQQRAGTAAPVVPAQPRSRPPTRERRRSLPARIAALGLLVAALLGVAAWLFWPTPPDDGDDAGSGGAAAVAASPTPVTAASSAAAGALTAAQRDLLDAVGVFDPADCRSPTGDPFDGQDTAVLCVDDDQTPDRVLYRRFTSITGRDAGFDRVAGDATDSGDCRTRADAAHAYQGDAGGGRVVCAADGQQAGVTWTLDGPVLASAVVTDPSAGSQLYAWWDERVGRDPADRLPDDCPTDDSLVQRTTRDGQDIGAAAAVRCERADGVATDVSYAQYRDPATLDAWMTDNRRRLTGARSYDVEELDRPGQCAGLGRPNRRGVAGRSTWSDGDAEGQVICFVNGASDDPDDDVDLNVLFWTDESTGVGAVAVSPARSAGVPRADRTTLAELIDEWRTAGYRTLP